MSLAAAAVFVALSAGLAVSVHEARVASSRQQQVRMMADKLVFDVHDAVRDLPGSTKARAVIVQTALHYLDSSVNSVQGDGLAEKELAKAYRRLGDVQGNLRAANLGDSSGALARYRQAITLLDDAIRRAARRRRRRSPSGSCYTTASARFTPSPDSFVMPCRRWRKASGSAGHSPARTTSTCGSALSASVLDCSRRETKHERVSGGTAGRVRSLHLAQAWRAERPSDPAVRYAVANAYAAVGMAESGLNQLEDALAHFRQGTAEMEALAASDRAKRLVEPRFDAGVRPRRRRARQPGLQNLGDRGGRARGVLEGGRDREDNCMKPIARTNGRRQITASC